MNPLNSDLQDRLSRNEELNAIETIISLIGAFASIGAAIWAYVEASNAKKSASKAENLRNEIIQKREVVEVSQVYTETQRILGIVSKIGPSANPKLLLGLDCNSIAANLEEYLRFINEHSSHFTELFENKAKNLCEALYPCIEALSEAASPDDKKNAGRDIYRSISAFMPEVKSLADFKKEKVTTN